MTGLATSPRPPPPLSPPSRNGICKLKEGRREPGLLVGSEIFLIRGEFLLRNGAELTEPQVAADGDAMTKMMSSFWGSLVRRPSVRRPPDGKKWSHNSGTLSFSSRFCRLDPPPIPPPSGHPSDNDNVAFGIPTDLETVRRTDRGRSGVASEREERREQMWCRRPSRFGGKHFSY